MAALAFSGDPPVGAIYAVAFFGGITMAFDNPTRRSFVVEMVPQDDINNAVSLNSALMTSSRVVGPALAGLLVSTVGFGWAFLGDGLSYLAVLAGLWMMRTEELRPAPVTPKAKGQVREGLRYVRSEPELFVPMAMMAVVGTLSYNFQTVFPLFVTRDLGGDRRRRSPLLFSVVSIGSLIGALVDGPARTIIERPPGVHGVARLRRHDGGSWPWRRTCPSPSPIGRGARARRRSRSSCLDRHRADRGGARDAGPGPGAAGHALPRQHAGRRPDRRLGGRGVRRPLRASASAPWPRWAPGCGACPPRPACAGGEGRRRLRLEDEAVPAA